MVSKEPKRVTHPLREWEEWKTTLGTDAAYRNAKCGCYEIAVAHYGRVDDTNCSYSKDIKL